jgi:glycosyltransferase involved in cell wall biosynthesis
MKILLANKYYYPRGGDCIYTIGLKNLLESKGHTVIPFSMQHSANLDSDYTDYWPVELDIFDRSFNNIVNIVSRPLYSVEVKNKFSMLLDNERPDIVHLNNIHTHLSPLIAKIAYQKGIPVVWTLHDYKQICAKYTMHRNGKICEDCFSTKTSIVINKCIKGNVIASILGFAENKTWSTNRLEKYTNYFLCPSEYLRHKFIEGGYSDNKLIQLYNFVDQSKTQTIEMVKKENYYVYFGRLSYEKGIKTLINAARDIPELKLKIVGTGPLSKEIIKETKQYEHIDILGFKNWIELKSILLKAKFFVIPSEWYENNPLSVLEAFALGLPGIGANIGGIPELIQDNITGVLFKSGSSGELKTKIRYMINEADLNRFSLNCKKISAEFSAENHYKKLIEIYKRVII